MSGEATFWAWDVDLDNVHQKIILLCLADCHSNRTGQCNPGVAYIVKKTGCNRKTVMKAIAELEQKNVITVDRKAGKSNWYQFQSSAFHGTSTARGTSTTQGTTTSPTQGTRPVPTKGPEPKRNLITTTTNDSRLKTVQEWEPNREHFNLLRMCGIDESFIEFELAEFKIYWSDDGSEKVSWDSAFLSHCKRQWERSRHANNRPKQDSKRPSKPTRVERLRSGTRDRIAELDREIAAIEAAEADGEAVVVSL